jgi:hypothetical protein
MEDNTACRDKMTLNDDNNNGTSKEEEAMFVGGRGVMS